MSAGRGGRLPSGSLSADDWQPILAAYTFFCLCVQPSLHPLIRPPPHPRLAHPRQSFSPPACPPPPLAGNIIGSLIAASMLKHGWGWSFVVPGAFIALCGAQQADGSSGVVKELVAVLLASALLSKPVQRCGRQGQGAARFPSGRSTNAPKAPSLAADCPRSLRLPTAAGLVVFSFLVVEPQDIGFLPQSGSVLGSEVGLKGRERRS